MKYAVISLAGQQHQVEENKTITINDSGHQVGDKITADQVLLAVNDNQVTIGQPTIAKAVVDCQVDKVYQGKKIRVFKYKAKSRYRKTQGFRSQLIDLKILKITA